jgi:hypothetical protein
MKQRTKKSNSAQRCDPGQPTTVVDFVYDVRGHYADPNAGQCAERVVAWRANYERRCPDAVRLYTGAS